MGAIPAARLYHTKYRELTPPPPHPRVLTLFKKLLSLKPALNLRRYELSLPTSCTFRFTTLSVVHFGCRHMTLSCDLHCHVYPFSERQRHLPRYVYTIASTMHDIYPICS